MEKLEEFPLFFWMYFAWEKVQYFERDKLGRIAYCYRFGLGKS